MRMDKGWLCGSIGMVIFAGSLPATRLATMAFDPWFVTAFRGSVAGGIACLLLLVSRQRCPSLSQWLLLAMVAGGVVWGFPLLTALALEYVSAAHSIVFLALLPLCTAIFSSIREKHRPTPLFWLFAIMGSACVMGFAISHISTPHLTGDLLMLAAVVVCGLGYAEGAVMSRRLGGWQVICWALVISLPLMLPLTVMTWPSLPHLPGQAALAGLAYVTLFSMLLGFFFWYKGLALGNTAKVGQLQLLQPFIALALSAVILGEAITPSMLLACLGALVCIAGVKRYG